MEGEAVVMRRGVAIVLLATMLLSCSNSDQNVDKGFAVRRLFMQEAGVRFDADITADYGDMTHSFSVQCEAASTGEVAFTVLKPDTISGVKGNISASGGQLLFGDKVLLFEPMVFGQISPVLAPWLMVKAILGGYIQSQSANKDGYQLIIDDTYENAELQLVLTLNREGIPILGEIIWSNRRILTIHITHFDKV